MGGIPGTQNAQKPAGIERVTSGMLCNTSCANPFRPDQDRAPVAGAADGESIMDIIQELEKEQIEKLSAGKEIPDFQPGDTLLVNVKVIEGDKTRVQAYEGVCIGRSGSGINENFTVRKISYGEGVERVFPLYSPMIDSIQVVRRGKVRRAKLYYLRGRRGKSARITERQDHRPGEEAAEAVEKAAE